MRGWPSRSRARPTSSAASGASSPVTTRGSDGGASLDLGIGGSRSPEHLKCLHAHVAFALARPGYELGERILAEVAEPWPAERCCSEGLRDGD